MTDVTFYIIYELFENIIILLKCVRSLLKLLLLNNNPYIKHQKFYFVS